MSGVLDFFMDDFPSWQLISWLLPASIVFGLAALFLAGHLKLRRNWKTGYSRKLFHFVVFSSAVPVQLFLGLPGTFVFGGGISLVVAYALIRGEGNTFYEALAREKDAPYRTLYIVLPYLATLSGGLLVNYLFRDEVAMMAYLLTGCGDAIGEPAGVRFGKHRYAVPSLSRVKSYRSMEGSAAVLITCVLLTLLLSVPVAGIQAGFGKALLIGGGFALIEGLSPHGWDNLSTMLGSAFLVSFFLF